MKTTGNLWTPPVATYHFCAPPQPHWHAAHHFLWMTTWQNPGLWLFSLCQCIKLCCKFMKNSIYPLQWWKAAICDLEACTQWCSQAFAGFGVFYVKMTITKIFPGTNRAMWRSWKAAAHAPHRSVPALHNLTSWVTSLGVILDVSWCIKCWERGSIWIGPITEALLYINCARWFRVSENCFWPGVTDCTIQAPRWLTHTNNSWILSAFPESQSSLFVALGCHDELRVWQSAVKQHHHLHHTMRRRTEPTWLTNVKAACGLFSVRNPQMMLQMQSEQSHPENFFQASPGCPWRLWRQILM